MPEPEQLCMMCNETWKTCSCGGRSSSKVITEVITQKPSWYKTFMDIAKIMARRSDDPTRKVGAVIIQPKTKAIISTGYNGLPRGIKARPEMLEKPQKLAYMVHAEANAIANASQLGVSTKGCTLFCTWPPCSSCAGLILQAGITQIVLENVKPSIKWKESMDAGLKMLQECSVAIRSVKGPISEYKYRKSKSCK